MATTVLSFSLNGEKKSSYCNLWREREGIMGMQLQAFALNWAILLLFLRRPIWVAAESLLSYLHICLGPPKIYHCLICESYCSGDIEQRCRRLCDRKINIKCDSFLEPCMGKLRSRRSQKLQADAPLIRKRSLAPGPETISSKDLTFVVFFAVGQRVSFLHAIFLMTLLRIFIPSFAFAILDCRFVSPQFFL